MSHFQPKPMYQQGGFPAKPTRGSGKATASLICGLLSFCLSLFAGIPAVITGIMALGDISKSQGQVGGKGMAITGIILGIVGTLIWIPMACLLPALMLPAVQGARDAARNVAAQQNLIQLGLALHQYHDRYRSFPAAGDPDADPTAQPAGGQLSWRVHILPFVGEQRLYDQFHMDEPWDSEHNKSLLAEMPRVFESPASGGAVGMTSFLAVVPGPNCPPQYRTMLMPSERGNFANTNDGVSNTVMLIDAGPNNLVEWTKPADFAFNFDAPKEGLQITASGLAVVLGDASAYSIDNSVEDSTLRWLFLANDGNPVTAW